MSEIKNIPSNEGWNKLVSYIIKATTVSEAIDDVNLKTDGTFSSVKIDALLRSLKEETEGYAETLCGNLARLELKIVDNAESCTESNILYLFKKDGASNYTEAVVIDGVVQELGEASVDLGNYYTKSECDTKFVLATSFEDIKRKVNTNTTDITDLKNDKVDKSDVSKIFSSDKAKGTTTIPESGVSSEKLVYDSYNDIMGRVVQGVNSSSTNEEIASAKAVYEFNKIKTYTKLEQLGLESGCSTGDIFNALPDNSYFEIGCNLSKTDKLYHVSDIPLEYGLLTIRKYDKTRFSIELKPSGGSVISPNELYIGQIKGNDGSNLSWKRVCTTNVSDISETKTKFTDTTYYDNYESSNAHSYYVVKNGICYVGLDFKVITSPATKSSVVFSGLPKPSRLMFYSITPNRDSSDITISNSTIALVSVDIYGNLKIRDGMKNYRYINTITYPVAES